MGIVDLIYPKKCTGCNRTGEYICPECWEGIQRAPAICPECCRPSMDGWVHGRCIRKLGMMRLITPYRYKGVLQRAMKKVKYKSAWGMMEEIGQKWMYSIEQDLLDTDYDDILITSVPMYLPKKKGRGFNQAETLARILANKLGVEYRELLVRTRETKAMYGLSKKERGENVKGAFGSINPKFSGLVILVDDVWTTGSTMRECSRELRKESDNNVWGVTVAR